MLCRFGLTELKRPVAVTVWWKVALILSSLSSGCTGDAYLELGDTDNALKSYKDATSSNNSFTSPKYLMKMAMVHEMNEDYSSSLEIYNKIKSDYKDSREAKTIEKFIARAQSR